MVIHRIRTPCWKKFPYKSYNYVFRERNYTPDQLSNGLLSFANLILSTDDPYIHTSPIEFDKCGDFWDVFHDMYDGRPCICGCQGSMLS